MEKTNRSPGSFGLFQELIAEARVCPVPQWISEVISVPPALTVEGLRADSGCFEVWLLGSTGRMYALGVLNPGAPTLLTIPRAPGTVCCATP